MGQQMIFKQKDQTISLLGAMWKEWNTWINWYEVAFVLNDLLALIPSIPFGIVF